jgi:DNA-binding GntR family transcriptional regulator
VIVQPPPEVPPSRARFVALKIEEALLRGELAPGDRLAERALAEQYGVSKTPVREALRDLARRGLITFHPYKGTVVTELSPIDGEQIFEVRLLVEPHAVQMAVPHHTRESLAKCRQALEAADVAGRKHGDLAELAVANRRFHQLLYQPCPNARLVSLLDNIQDQVALISATSWRRTATWPNEQSEHAKILDAVSDGSETVFGLLRDHIERFFNRIAGGEGT